MTEMNFEKPLSNAGSDEQLLDLRRLHIMGLLQQFVSHQVMNSLTRAVINLDSGNLEKTRVAIYQSATALQELQLLGEPSSPEPFRRAKMSDVLRNAISLTSGMLKENHILAYEDLKDASEAFVRPQAQLLSLLEILVAAVKSLAKSHSRSLFMNVLSLEDSIRLNFIAHGTDLDFNALGIGEPWGLGLAKKIAEADSGSFWIERDPTSYRICLQFQKFIGGHPKG